MLTPEVQSKIAEYRAKATAGTLTIEEMRNAIILLRGNRTLAAQQVKSSRSKSAKAPARSADDLLGELGGL